MIYYIIIPIFSLFATISGTNFTNNRDYVISTEGCKIPAFPVFNDKIKRLMKATKFPDCTDNLRLVEFNSTHIWIIKESLDFYNVLTTNDFYCCYKKFYAENNIQNIRYGACSEFSEVIEARHEFVRVECFYLDDKIYDDFFLFPLFTGKNMTKNISPTFNVLLFGIESMSRMNFLRTMPKTAKFLQDKGGIQLMGYNKIGDNSYPNLFPLLNGESYEHAKNNCIRFNVIDTVKCEFLWSKFKAAGYDTALGSDSIAGLLGTYEYSLTKLPTDYYLQPFIFETRYLFKNQHFNFHQCLRNRYFYKLLLNWVKGLLINSRNKLFGIFWQESISHENFNLPHIMDDDHHSFLTELEKSRYLEDTIIIFFSDHGTRWGEIAKTEQGRLEDRLPLFDIVLSPTFQRRYPLAYDNFKENQFRLTSPYDIHETLLNIIKEDALELFEINKKSTQIAFDISELSLFLPIPKQRKCEFIGIREHWCTCNKKERQIPNKKQRILAARKLQKHLNDLLKGFPQCHQLEVTEILNATLATDRNDTILIYRLVIRTSPGGGIFDGTLYREGLHWVVSGIVSRLNLYRYNSQCVQNCDIKMYCTCKQII